MIVNRKTGKFFLAVVLMLAMVFPASVFAASGDLTSIGFDTSESEIQLTVAETTKQLRVLAAFEGSTTKKDVTNEASWTSSSSKIVKVDGGLLTPLDQGTVTITAKYKTSVTTIKVVSKYAAEEFKINQPKEVEYKLGTEGIEVKALADSTNDVTTAAEWSSSNEGVATVDKGKLKLIGKGEATITATYKGLKDSYKIKVVSPYTKLSIAPGDVQEMLVGDSSVQLTVYAKTSDSEVGQGTDVTASAELKSSDTSVAKIVDGKLEPVALGKATITATYLGSKATMDVYVRNPYEALILSNAEFVKNPVMFLQDEVKVEATVRNLPEESVPVTAEWTSSNPLSVTVDNGTIKAKATGTSSIKVSYRGVSKEFRVTVHPTVTAFKTDEDKLELVKGESKSTPKVTGTLLDNETQDFSKSVQWTTDNEKVAVVDDGKVKAVAEGNAVLTGMIGSKKVAGITVSVRDKVLVLMPSVEEYQLISGKSATLPEVTAVLENGTEEKVSGIEWSMTGTTAVVKDGSIKGLAKGSAVLKGTYLNQSLKIPVTVEQEIVKIKVEPESVELNLKKSKSIKVTGYFANGKTINLSSKMNWVSSNPSVATTSRSSVKAVAEGNATITGSYQGKEASVQVKVVPKLTKLIPSEKKITLAPGTVKTVSLTAEYDTGKTNSVTSNVLWTSSKPSVAKVTEGKIEAVAKGTARIKAKFDSKTVSITVKVK